MAKSEMQLVVLQGFIGNVAGKDQVFKPGDTIDAGHPAIKKWPHLFGPAVSRHETPVIEQATAAPGEKRGG